MHFSALQTLPDACIEGQDLCPCRDHPGFNPGWSPWAHLTNNTLATCPACPGHFVHVGALCTFHSSLQPSSITGRSMCVKTGYKRSHLLTECQLRVRMEIPREMNTACVKSSSFVQPWQTVLESFCLFIFWRGFANKASIYCRDKELQMLVCKRRQKMLE